MLRLCMLALRRSLRKDRWFCIGRCEILTDVSADGWCIRFFAFRPEDNELEDDTHNAIKSLGVDRIFEVLRQAQHRLSRTSR